jgi:ParB/RepB/Spo0J family partition protein
MSKKQQHVEVEFIDINVVKQSETNPRKEFNQEALQELADSIKKIGLIQPITVSKVGDDYCVICGERRLRAAKLAGLEMITAIVHENLEGDVILEMQIIENMQRKNINPMEESDAFQVLVKRGISTPEMIADKLGTSTKYVYDRLKLQDAIKEVQDLVREGKVSITLAKQFTKLPKSDQKTVFEDVEIDETTTPKDIRDAINGLFQLKLEDAPFDKSDKNLVKKAGACEKCDKRTGCRTLLFDDISQEDICLDEKCYNSKVEAHINSLKEKLEKEGYTVKLISLKYGSDREDVLVASDWSNSEYEETGVKGIIVEIGFYRSNRKIGEVLDISFESEEPESDDDLEDEDSVNIGSPSNAISKSTVDIEDIFSKKLVEMVSMLFKVNAKKLFTFDIQKYFIEEAIGYITSIDEELVKQIFELLELVYDEDVDLNKTLFTDFMNKCSYARVEEVFVLVKAFQSIDHHASNVYDTDIADLKEEIGMLGINIDQVVADIEEEAGDILYQREEVEETE